MINQYYRIYKDGYECQECGTVDMDTFKCPCCGKIMSLRTYVDIIDEAIAKREVRTCKSTN